uniref:Zinc finger protein n=1 Tax=Meloidogyne hapla TaxID=6305 RepID=A0A1I8BJ21_MELHA
MISPQHLSNLDAHLESYHPDEHKSVKAAKEKRKEKIALRKAQKLQSSNIDFNVDHDDEETESEE